MSPTTFWNPFLIRFFLVPAALTRRCSPVSSASRPSTAAYLVVAGSRS